MVILYNPQKPNGSDISGFVIKDIGVIEPHPAGELRQYTENIADQLKENFQFLQEVSPEDAKKIIESKGKTYKCDFPNCDFSTDTPIALSGHKRTHQAESPDTVIDPTLVPVAGARPVQPHATAGRPNDMSGHIPNGVDADGITWYGEDLHEESNVEIRRPGDPGFFGGS